MELTSDGPYTFPGMVFVVIPPPNDIFRKRHGAADMSLGVQEGVSLAHQTSPKCVLSP